MTPARNAITNQQSNTDGFEKLCRDCGKTFYLHRSSSGGRWRAYDSSGNLDSEVAEWTRHRCAAALKDADEMAAILPSGLSDPIAIQRLERLVEDLQALIAQLKTRAEAVTARTEAAKRAAAEAAGAPS